LSWYQTLPSGVSESRFSDTAGEAGTRAESAALVDEVFAKQPVRQWVLQFLSELRRMADDCRDAGGFAAEGNQASPCSAPTDR
jgi:hypothetical protein